MFALVCFVLGLGAGAVLWRAMAPIWALPFLARENFRGRALSTAAGLAAVVAVIGAEGAITVADALGVELPTGSIEARRLAVLAVVGFGFLGFLDDLGGVGQSGGFRGHLRALAKGELTTGAIKLFGGAALSIVVVAIGSYADDVPQLIADAALVALSANLANLLDRAPGRVLKGGAVVFAVLAVGTGLGPELAGTALALGALLALLVPDLRERAMLGDVGANALGAVLGVGVVVTCSPEVRIAVLVGLAALNLLSEVVSFSKVIERTPPLRFLDRIGREPPDEAPTALR
jgi:UDP-N-acetylmuramyl pentapeptide phosphotransferase/UDP-N-acetylglucosamine-1-phosphate transferase